MCESSGEKERIFSPSLPRRIRGDVPGGVTVLTVKSHTKELPGTKFTLPEAELEKRSWLF